MRLFIAIDIPEEPKRQLEALQDPNLDIRWSDPSTIHLTLRFIGDVESPVKETLHHRLKEIDRPSFAMSIQGLGYFPPKKNPKVLWAGVKEIEPLMSLQEEIEQACRSVGLEPERRSFKPHVTIGRVQGASKKEVLSFINQHKKFRYGHIPVNTFMLFRSKLRPEGAVHTPLEQYELT